MTTIPAIFNPSQQLINIGCPAYIKSKSINLPVDYASPTFLGKPLTKIEQIQSYEIITTENPGWLCYVSGNLSSIRTFAAHIAETYMNPSFGFYTQDVSWINTAYNNRFDQISRHNKLIILDCLTKYDGQLDINSVRNIHGLISRVRGTCSVLLLCADLPLDHVIGKILPETPDIGICLK
jgi:hypothetical protein